MFPPSATQNQIAGHCRHPRRRPTVGDKASKVKRRNLARSGFVVLSINYALSTNGKVTWPQNVFDCKTAVRWLRKNAERLQLDADHIGVIGGSAGGHLAAFLAVTGPKDGFDPPGPYPEYSCRVQCAVDLYGPTDLHSYKDLPMFGKSKSEAPELYKAASPLSYVRKNNPPILILHGTADKKCVDRTIEALARAREGRRSCGVRGGGRGPAHVSLAAQTTRFCANS